MKIIPNYTLTPIIWKNYCMCVSIPKSQPHFYILACFLCVCKLKHYFLDFSPGALHILLIAVNLDHFITLNMLINFDVDHVLWIDLIRLPSRPMMNPTCCELTSKASEYVSSRHVLRTRHVLFGHISSTSLRAIWTSSGIPVILTVFSLIPMWALNFLNKGLMFLPFLPTKRPTNSDLISTASQLYLTRVKSLRSESNLFLLVIYLW